ncbi:MAG: ATP-binding cassette domain-containing protein [Desulfobulbaceae bacterium]|nr:MAG: ATP-binding cassette domain-containing protein [Desulfobulbaceae bacterium]
MNQSMTDIGLELRNKIEPFGWLSRTGPPSPFAECIAPLLTALKWNGEIHQLCESLPHYPDQMDRVDIINVFSNLHYSIGHARISKDSFDERLCPCLVVTDQGQENEHPYVLFKSGQDEILAYDGASGSLISFSMISARRIDIYSFEPLTEESLHKSKISDQVDESPRRWFTKLLLRFGHVGKQILLSSFLINLLALVSSLYVMTVYDKVIGSRAPDTLVYLGFGAILAILFETVLRYLRARSLAFFGVRLDAIITTAIFERLLFLPPRIVENSSTSVQIARLKDFDSVRNFFAGPLGISAHELPFTVIFIVAIWIVGGPLAKIPLLLIVAYGLLGALMLPRIQASTEAGAAAGAQRQALMVETMRKMRALKINGVKNSWLSRFKELSGVSSYASFNTSLQTAFVESISYGLSVAASATTLTYGIFLVWDGVITTGGLIATMMLIWRVIGPLQATCNALVRIRYLGRSIVQVHNLMSTEPEHKPTISEDFLTLKGDITFSGVGLRYSADRAALYSGMSLEIEKGEIVAVSGSSGSGKSSFLKLIMGLYPPQMGAIRIDGVDIRQRDPVGLRRNIAYVPQTPELFHGSIEQNLRMCRPEASPQYLEETLELAGALTDVKKLKDGLGAFIGDYRSEQLSSNLTYQLTLARAYLRDASIMLVDEMPPSLLSHTTAENFRAFCEQYRTNKTIVFVTDREADILRADRLVYLTGSGQVLTGKPAELIAALKGE